MSLDLFKKTLDKFPSVLTQVALGIGDLGANRDLWDIMRYCRSCGVVPNITINGAGLTDRRVGLLAELCGAVAVSAHDFEVCFSAVRKLNRAGLKQVNIHALVSADTLHVCRALINAVQIDRRLKDLNALVFLALKQIGQRNDLEHATEGQFAALVKSALSAGIKVGFDSCSAPSFLKAIRERDDRERLELRAESCESYLYSIYVDVQGKAFPCSFCASEPDGGHAIAECVDFVKDVWMSEKAENWRNLLRASGRRCPKRIIYGGTENEN